MGARERAPAQLRIARERLLLDQLADRAKPPVLQLAHVELTMGCGVLGPAQEHVARRLHDALALDHALALMAVELRRQPLEHGLAGFLELQEQRRAVATHVEPDGAERADAADADNLEGDVLERVAIEETEAVGRQPA